MRSVYLAVALIAGALKAAPKDFKWRTERYEYITDRLAIDLLFGSTGPREALENGASALDVVKSFEPNERAFAERRRGALLYT